LLSCNNADNADNADTAAGLDAPVRAWVGGPVAGDGRMQLTARSVGELRAELSKSVVVIRNRLRDTGIRQCARVARKA
jgi:hypothetical protein